MDQQEVHIIRESFMTDIGHKITWAIPDGQSFLNRVLVKKDHFTRTNPFLWPTALIGQIADDIQYGKKIFGHCTRSNGPLARENKHRGAHEQERGRD